MAYLEGITLEKTIDFYEETSHLPVDGLVLGFLKELKEYRDAEEQGLLKRLPVAEGSVVFVIDHMFECEHDYECPFKFLEKYKCDEGIYCEYKYKEYYIRESIFNHTMMKFLGKTVFLTKEEAEHKLEEIRGE